MYNKYKTWLYREWCMLLWTSFVKLRSRRWNTASYALFTSSKSLTQWPHLFRKYLLVNARQMQRHSVPVNSYPQSSQRRTPRVTSLVAVHCKEDQQPLRMTHPWRTSNLVRECAKVLFQSLSHPLLFPIPDTQNGWGLLLSWSSFIRAVLFILFISIV